MLQMCPILLNLFFTALPSFTITCFFCPNIFIPFIFRHSALPYSVTNQSYRSGKKMKVLKWVHRRFLNVQSCTAFLEENGEGKDNEMRLLEHNADMLHTWKDGILCIGTLAISPLEAGKCGILEEIIDGDYDNDVENDVDEASPLMNVELFSHELEKIADDEDQKDNWDEIERQAKRRVTLAQLFMEDSDYKADAVQVLKDEDDDDILTEKQAIQIIFKPTSVAKNGLSKAKKLLKQDLHHPLKKFNQLMKRMMKKKIHPDLEEKTQKDKQMHPSYGFSNPTNNDQGSTNYELASLLLIQDAMV